MKKTILAILMAMVATTAFAEGKCEGGVPFEGVNDGHEYCISKESMTWWAAFAWCQHQGRHLTSLQEACDGWNGTTGTTQCGNLVKSGVGAKGCWTATSTTKGKAYNVNAGTGNLIQYGRDCSNGCLYALCY